MRLVNQCLVLQAIALYWEMLPFCIFIGIPLLVLSRISQYSITGNGVDILVSWLFVAFLIIVLPEVSIQIFLRRPQL